MPRTLIPTDPPSPPARRLPCSRRGDGWDTVADIEVFVFAVEAELEAMERERVGVHRRGRKPDLALRRRLVGPIWTLTFGGMDWRLAQGDEVPPSAVVVDSRSLRSAPTAWTRGIDGGKLIKGVKLLAICDKHGSLLDLELRPANVDDRAGTLPILPRLAALGFQGELLGDSGFKGDPFAAAARVHDIHVSASPGGTRDGKFLPSGIRWVVERLFAWMSRDRRLNIVFDRQPDLFAAHVWIAMISIISRRLVAQAQAQQGI